ncbi:MAG: FAD-dependent oxidoreductase [Lachnospiraceae bacterium]|nr:FAD-dependent oxidoreductase [Lachnospiraceae bacterium]
MKFVVIGASAAGTNAVRKLRDLNPDAEIVMISADTAIYSRCILYHHLKGERDLEGLNFVGPNFEERMNITWIKGVKATGVDCDKNILTLSDGQEVSYDKLCIATGSHPNFFPIPGLREGKNVTGFRNFEDVEFIEERLEKAQNIFVMGAGLVGIDVVAGLVKYNKNITLADMAPYMLGIQLDDYSAGVYGKMFAERGVKQYYNMGAKEFVLDEDGNCYKVILNDGTEIPTDLVINCAGVRANVEFLEGSKLECDRFGLIFDEHGQTNVPNVYGAGDVSGKNPIWPVAVKEGMIAAYNMSGIKRSMDDFFASKSTMNFLGLASMSLGKANRYDDTYTEEIFKDEEKGIYKKIVHKDGVITGAILQGDLSYSGVLTQLIRRKIDVTKVKKPLFKIDYSDFFREKENFEFYYEKEEERP